MKILSVLLLLNFTGADVVGVREEERPPPVDPNLPSCNYMDDGKGSHAFRFLNMAYTDACCL
jgi:hypothetical protein